MLEIKTTVLEITKFTIHQLENDRVVRLGLVGSYTLKFDHI